LKPRKSTSLIPEVAQETGYSEDVVETVVSYYWREIRKQLSSLAHSRVHVVNLGDFVVKHWKIDERIDHLQKWEETNRQKGLQKATARFKIAEQLYEVRKLKDIMDEEKQRKEFVRLHKRTLYEQTREHHSHMESQGSDT
jgi:nucleoid DNA-binding protein